MNVALDIGICIFVFILSSIDVAIAVSTSTLRSDARALLELQVEQTYSIAQTYTSNMTQISR